MSQYRQGHPDYIAKNRDQQKFRNQKRRMEQQQQKIVKMDALVKQLEKSDIYLMIPYQVDASQKIVKMDTLLVQLKVIHGTRAALLSNLR